MCDEPLPSIRSVIAACGCGHDGRLGIGKPLRTQTVLSTSSVTLLPHFVEQLRADPHDHVASIHCGGYHTIVLMHSGVLYGWGLHEDGQLGLGGLGKGGGEVCYYSPTPLTFFDELYDDNVKEFGADKVGDRKGFILSVSCGASHSMVLTSCGLYACGKNTHGQLGLGTDDNIFVWASLSSSSLLSGRMVHFRVIEPTDDMALSNPSSNYAVVKGELTHISCGTHHTILAWKDVWAVKYDEKEDERILEFSPVLLMAAGKGDFGELGYDGDPMEVLLAREKRMHSALKSEATRTMNQGGINTDDNGSTLATQPGYFSNFAKKYQKQRRPDFFSKDFKPVHFPLLNAQAVHATCGTDSFEAIDVPSNIRAIRHSVVAVRAQHLHSDVVIKEENLDEGTEVLRTFHWGCYYCGEVEELHSSIPEEVLWEGVHNAYIHLHASNERLIKYLDTSSVKGTQDTQPIAMIRGEGTLGLGEDLDFAKEWTPLVTSSDTTGGIVDAQGRDHILLLLSKGNQPAVGQGEVWGFGSNLHGQLGLASEEDSVHVMTPLLRVGDVVHLPSPDSVATPSPSGSSTWKVQRIRSVGAGVNHSVFMLDIVAAS